MKLEITVNGQAPVRVIVVKGDVDMDSSPELRDEIKRTLKGLATLKLDLRDVGYIDSSGIAVLIQGLKWAKASRTDFRLVAPSAQVRSVMELSQLQSLFPTDEAGA